MTPVQFMVAALKARIENLTPAQVAAELDDPFVLLVDVREPGETEYGSIPGAVRVPRGMLEFHADHGTSSHVEGFEPGRRVIVYCSAGSRSAPGPLSAGDRLLRRGPSRRWAERLDRRGQADDRAHYRALIAARPTPGYLLLTTCKRT